MNNLDITQIAEKVVHIIQLDYYQVLQSEPCHTKTYLKAVFAFWLYQSTHLDDRLTFAVVGTVRPEQKMTS